MEYSYYGKSLNY